MPNLRVTDKKRDFVHQIEGDVVTVGRGPNNTVSVDDTKASKEHCRIQRVGDRWKLVDLESKNGTRVNDGYCNRAWLQHGDTIRIGTAELRFTLEGAARGTAPGPAAPARAAPAPETSVAAPTRAAAREAAEGTGERAGGLRYRRDESTEKLLKWGAIVVGCALIVLITGFWVNRTTGDPHNEKLLQQANRLVAEGRFEDAIAHLERYGDTSGNAYYLVLQRINELRERAPAYRLNVREEGARKVVSDLGRKIKAYHQGKTRTTSPEQILQLVERLKTEFAGTDYTEAARQQWPHWFAGTVPERASEYLASGGKLKKDWEATIRQADEYRKEWHYREARETVEKFLTVREAIMDENDRTFYKEAVRQHLKTLDGLADSDYRGVDRVARDLVKNRRYDEAIRQMQRVIDSFGIDLYVHKARAQIEKIRELKATNKIR